jgi:hypothetical protein
VTRLSSTKAKISMKLTSYNIFHKKKGEKFWTVSKNKTQNTLKKLML